MKPIFFMGSSRADLRAFPEDVRAEAGFSIYMAQEGDKAANAVSFLGFGGAKVLEVVMDHDTNTFRAVYTVKFPQAVYVLHVFQKKSHRGRMTPKMDMDLIRHRLKQAEQHYAGYYKVRVEKERSNDN